LLYKQGAVYCTCNDLEIGSFSSAELRLKAEKVEKLQRNIIYTVPLLSIVAESPIISTQTNRAVLLTFQCFTGKPQSWDR